MLTIIGALAAACSPYAPQKAQEKQDFYFELRENPGNEYSQEPEPPENIAKLLALLETALAGNM